MKVLMVSTDRKIFAENSAVKRRMEEYGNLTDELHIIVFSSEAHGISGEKPHQISKNVWAYATNSSTKFSYIEDAKKIGEGLVDDGKWIVTTQDPFETGLVGKHISKRFKIPFQAQVHTDFKSEHFRNETFLNKIRLCIAPAVLKAATCVRVVSNRIAQSIKEKSFVLPIFVDVDNIMNTAPSFDLHKEYDDFENIILVVSRLEKEKNVELAVNSFKKVMEKYPKTGLVIVGDGSHRANLEFMGVRNVVFVGWQSEMISYYKTSDIYLNTSNYEGYGMTLVEAASAGTPIVTTDVGVVGDVLIDGESALVSEIGDEGSVASNLIKLIEDKKLRGRLADKARSSINKHKISKSEYLSKYQRLWENCIN